MKLYEIAHSRTGDKGNISTISLIARKEKDYEILKKYVTEEKVKEHMAFTNSKTVTRYELDSIHALNFVLEDALAGGVTKSLNLDRHGKSYSSFLLEMELDL